MLATIRHREGWMDTFGRIIDERTFELLLVTGGALVMGLLTLIYLI